MEFSKSIKIAIGVICCIGIVLAIALPVASLKSLDPTEIGLDYDTTSVSLDESQLYTAGRHFIGVAHEFVIYKFEIRIFSFNVFFFNFLAHNIKELSLIISLVDHQLKKNRFFFIY